MEQFLRYLKRYPLAAGLAATSLVLFAVFSFRGGRAEELVTLRDEKELELRRMERTIANLSRIEEQTHALEEILQRGTERLSNPEDKAINLDYFLQMEGDFALEITPRQTSVGSGKAAGKKTPWTLTAHDTVRFSLDVQGPLRETIRFVKQLPRGEKLLSINSFQLVPSGEDPEDAQLMLTLDLLTPPIK